MPMTLLEAFAVGTPVISSNLGAMQSMTHVGKNGWLFSPGDASDLRKKATRWLDMDAAYRQRIGEGAQRAYEEAYSATQNQVLLTNIYRSVIARDV